MSISRYRGLVVVKDDGLNDAIRYTLEHEGLGRGFREGNYIRPGK
jgi:hypothetical protein